MGNHTLLEVYDVDPTILNEKVALLDTLKRGAILGGMTILNEFVYQFDPQGVTIVLALSESHISIHTWPERQCAAIDVYTCGSCDNNKVVQELLTYLNTNTYNKRNFLR
jgi:S-adenosylmethionine decarboxylase